MVFHIPLRNGYFELSAWKFSEPFFNVQHVFVFDLALAGQLSSFVHPLPPGISVEIHLKPDESDLHRILALFEQAGLRPRPAEESLKRGEMLALATANEAVAAYTWTAFSCAWVGEARRSLSPRDDQAVQYNTFVIPSWRGKGLQYGITRPVLQHLAKLGYKQTIAWVNARNVRSIRNQLSQGKRCVATITSSPILGLVRLRRLSQEADFTIERFRQHS